MVSRRKKFHTNVIKFKEILKLLKTICTDLPSITDTVPIQFGICSSLSYKDDVLASINSSYDNYVREANWFGNTTNATAEDVFHLISFKSSELIDYVKVFTEKSTWFYRLEGFSIDDGEILDYNESIPTPFSTFR